MILVQIFKPKEGERLPDISELKNLFHECMPLFIALGDEIRLSIIESLTDAAYRTCDGDFSSENLSRHGLNVREITDKTNLSRPAVSHHLKLLKDAGLISIRREGTCNYYYLTIGQSTRQLTRLGTELQSFLGMDTHKKAGEPYSGALNNRNVSDGMNSYE